MSNGTTVEAAVNNKADATHSHSAAQVGAAAVNHTHTAAQVGALATNGTAAAATKLATARSVRTNLASTAAANFNGTANITPGVSGILPVANGGTGVNSIANLKTALGITPTSAVPPEYPSQVSYLSVNDEFGRWAEDTWKVVATYSTAVVLTLTVPTVSTIWSSEWLTGPNDYEWSTLRKLCIEFAASRKFYLCDFIIPYKGDLVWVPAFHELRVFWPTFNEKLIDQKWWTSTVKITNDAGTKFGTYCVPRDGNGNVEVVEYSSVSKTEAYFRPFIMVRR